DLRLAALEDVLLVVVAEAGAAAPQARRPEAVVPRARAAVGAAAVHALLVHRLAVAEEDPVIVGPRLVDRDHDALAVAEHDQALLDLLGDRRGVVVALGLRLRAGRRREEEDRSGDESETGECTHGRVIIRSSAMANSPARAGLEV